MRVAAGSAADFSEIAQESRLPGRTDAVSVARNGASPAQADEPFPAQGEIDAADEIVAEERLGALTTPYTIPFSAQFKAEARKRYPVDEPFYETADKIERKTLVFYLQLRAFEIASYAGFLVGSYYSVLYSSETDALLSTLLNGTKTVSSLATITPLIVFSFAAAMLLRIGVRWAFFKEIHEAARDMSYSFYARYKDITTKVMDYGYRSQSRTGSGGSWQERAHHWIKAALWNGERAEYLNRYSTAVSWRIHFRIGAYEAGSWLAMAGMFTVFVMMLVHKEETAGEAVPVIIAVSVASILGWGVFARRRASFWTEEFRKTFSDDEFACAHQFNVIPDVVRDLVSTIIANDRNAVS